MYHSVHVDIREQSYILWEQKGKSNDENFVCDPWAWKETALQETAFSEKAQIYFRL